MGMNMAAIVERAIAYGVPCRQRKKGTRFEESRASPAAILWLSAVRTLVDAPCRSSSTGLIGLGSAR